MTSISIETSKHKVKIGTQTIELTLEEMRVLRDKLDAVVGRPAVAPIVLPEDPPKKRPYRSPWDEYPPWKAGPYDSYPKIWMNLPSTH